MWTWSNKLTIKWSLITINSTYLVSSSTFRVTRGAWEQKKFLYFSWINRRANQSKRVSYPASEMENGKSIRICKTKPGLSLWKLQIKIDVTLGTRETGNHRHLSGLVERLPVWSHTCLFFLLWIFDPGNGGLGKCGSGRSPARRTNGLH